MHFGSVLLRMNKTNKRIRTKVKCLIFFRRQVFIFEEVVQDFFQDLTGTQTIENQLPLLTTTRKT